MVTKRKKRLTKKQLRYFGTARQRAALRRRHPTTKAKRRVTTKRRKSSSLAGKLLNFIKGNWGAAVAGALVGYSAKSLQDWLATRGQSPEVIAKVAAAPVTSIPNIVSNPLAGVGGVVSRVLNAGEQVAMNAWGGVVAMVNPQPTQPNIVAPTLLAPSHTPPPEPYFSLPERGFMEDSAGIAIIPALPASIVANIPYAPYSEYDESGIFSN